MTFVVSHPTGNTFVRALLEELQKRDLLSSFFTTIGFGKGHSALFSKIKNNRTYDIPDSKISRLWYPELKRLLVKTDHATSRRLTDASYRELDAKTAKELSFSSLKFIHAYEDGAFNTFRKAKELGIQCSYELPIAHWATNRRLLAEEAERYPEWETTLETTCEPEEKLLKKEEELRLADRITCPSEFVMESIPAEIRNRVPCQISPFGSPRNPPLPTPRKREKKQDKSLKTLFVGSMSQRKGLADIFEAMKLLKKEPVQLSILGKPSMPMEFYREQCTNFKYYHACTNQGVQQIMKEHDVLVLPSIIEGRALVQQEALACGIPLIVTPNAGGKDLIEEGMTGHLVPIRSPEKIAEKIISCLESNLSKLDRSIICQEKARAFSWNSYAQKIIDFNYSTTSRSIGAS